MTVTRLRAEMPYDEFIRWHVYHGRKQQRQEMQERKARAQQARARATAGR